MYCLSLFAYLSYVYLFNPAPSFILPSFYFKFLPQSMNIRYFYTIALHFLYGDSTNNKLLIKFNKKDLERQQYSPRRADEFFKRQKLSRNVFFFRAFPHTTMETDLLCWVALRLVPSSQKPELDLNLLSLRYYRNCLFG